MSDTSKCSKLFALQTCNSELKFDPAELWLFKVLQEQTVTIMYTLVQSFDLQRVLEGEKALRSEATRQLKEVEKKLVSLRSPAVALSSPMPAPPGSEQGLEADKTLLQDQIKAHSAQVAMLLLATPDIIQKDQHATPSIKISVQLLAERSAGNFLAEMVYSSAHKGCSTTLRLAQTRTGMCIQAGFCHPVYVGC